MKTLEESILELVNAPGYRPVKPRVIAEQLKLPKDDAVLVRRMVKQLVRHGKIRYASNHLVLPANTPTASADMAPKASSKTPRSSRGPTARGTGDQGQLEQLPAKTARKSAGGKGGNRVVGVFQRTQKGFGFVRLDQAGGKEKAKDIYIPAEESADAATGDVVLVEIGRQRGRELGPRGRIVEVVERQTHQFVGTYFESAGAAYVRIDGAMFARPISVGDPGAKNARADDKVVVEMLRFPSPLHDGEGVIAEVLGPRGKPGVDTLSIIREFNLPDRFAEDAIEEADRQADAFDEAIGGRKDFTGETIVTIDPVDARDFDDAISLERLDGGHWRLGVHIADVSHFVRPKTALDREAIERATSVYLPDRVLPMLPEVISNGLASLQPGKVRYTKSAVMEFTEEGLRVSTELYSAAIRSSKRLTYEQVDEFLTDREASRRKLGGKVCDLLGRMHTLAMTMRKRRLANGALELTMPEVKVDLDRHGRVSGAHVVENSESHQIIEEFMLAANEAVAEAIRDRGLHFLRRVHQSPSPQKLDALREFVAELGYKTGSLQSRFELQKLLNASTGRPEQHAVHFAVLRSLQRAIYSPMEEGHYALASECYCHFTSPIRRYPDLTIHRLVDAMLTKSKPRNDYDELVVLARHCSDREQRAEAAERDLTKLKLLAYLSTRIGEEMEAVVTGVESYGLFVQGVQLPAEGLVRVETLRDDHYYFDRASHTLAGHRAGNSYRLGDLLRVAVARVDLERREIDFRVVEREKGRPAVSTKATKGTKKTGREDKEKGGGKKHGRRS
ncbi:MAG: ribonuclease R [Thermoguttaceae bacterium]|jgi:ribonuclease R